MAAVVLTTRMEIPLSCSLTRSWRCPLEDGDDVACKQAGLAFDEIMAE